MAILVFDLGGSAVKYGLWTEKLEQTGQFATPATWEEMTEQMLLVKGQFSEQEREGVALSAPGVVNEQTKQIEGISAIPYIHYRPIFTELETLFGLPVTIENDANCAGLAEIHEGAAKGRLEVAFVVLGTGVGGAVFHKGELVKGAHLYGGEFGLMFLDGGQTFSELGTAVQMAWRYCDRKGVARDVYTGKDVFAFAEQGDQLAAEEVENFYNYVVQGLFSIQLSLDPEVIVLGGGVSSKPGLLEEINRRMELQFQHFDLKDFLPKIVLCEYRNDANLVGAAANFLTKKNWE